MKLKGGCISSLANSFQSMNSKKRCCLRAVTPPILNIVLLTQPSRFVLDDRYMRERAIMVIMMMLEMMMMLLLGMMIV